jgi:hypothetical protein
MNKPILSSLFICDLLFFAPIKVKVIKVIINEDQKLITEIFSLKQKRITETSTSTTIKPISNNPVPYNILNSLSNFFIISPFLF